MGTDTRAHHSCLSFPMCSKAMQEADGSEELSIPPAAQRTPVPHFPLAASPLSFLNKTSFPDLCLFALSLPISLPPLMGPRPSSGVGENPQTLIPSPPQHKLTLILPQTAGTLQGQIEGQTEGQPHLLTACRTQPQLPAPYNPTLGWLIPEVLFGATLDPALPKAAAAHLLPFPAVPSPVLPLLHAVGAGRMDSALLGSWAWCYPTAQLASWGSMNGNAERRAGADTAQDQALL